MRLQRSNSGETVEKLLEMTLNLDGHEIIQQFVAIFLFKILYSVAYNLI